MSPAPHQSSDDRVFRYELAGRIHRKATPEMGFDQGDTDQLYRIARNLADPITAANILRKEGYITPEQYNPICANIRAKAVFRGNPA